MFACLVIKFETPLVLKVETRATLEQKMMPIKNEQVRTKKHDLNFFIMFFPAIHCTFTEHAFSKNSYHHIFIREGLVIFHGVFGLIDNFSKSQ